PPGDSSTARRRAEALVHPPQHTSQTCRPSCGRGHAAASDICHGRAMRGAPRPVTPRPAARRRARGGWSHHHQEGHAMFQDLLVQLHDLVSGLAPWQQVLAPVPAGAIPFIASYLGSFLGTTLGIHPALAIPAAVLGNLVATFVVIALAGRTRDAIAQGRGKRGGGSVEERSPSRFRARVAAA